MVFFLGHVVVVGLRPIFVDLVTSSLSCRNVSDASLQFSGAVTTTPKLFEVLFCLLSFLNARIEHSWGDKAC
jgi:hypothetical protein